MKNPYEIKAAKFDPATGRGWVEFQDGGEFDIATRIDSADKRRVSLRTIQHGTGVHAPHRLERVNAWLEKAYPHRSRVWHIDPEMVKSHINSIKTELDVVIKHATTDGMRGSLTEAIDYLDQAVDAIDNATSG